MTKEVDLITILAEDMESDDKVRVIQDESSRNITLQDFTEAQKGILEGLGFMTPTTIPASISQNRQVTTTTASTYNVLSTDSVVLCDTTSNLIAITLPTSATAFTPSTGTSQQFTIKRSVSNNAQVIISAQGASLIDGVGQLMLNGPQLTSVTLITDGTNWFTLGV